MKARTKAEKIRAKKGRPRMDNVPREPNGKVSRSGIDHEPANVVAITARARHTGLPVEKAKDQKAASFIGYLNLIGSRDGLSDDQYEAATKYLTLRAAYLKAIKAPDRTLDNGIPGSAGDEISDGYVEWCKRTRDRYGECRRAIQESQNETRENLWSALDYCIIRDERHSHMIGGLRLVCNALARFFRG